MQELPVFFLLTYLVSWACFIVAARIPALAGTSTTALAALRGPLFLLGTFAPALVALGLAVRNDGRRGATALLHRIIQWRAPLRWYLFAAGFMAATKLAVAVVYRLTSGGWPRFGQESWHVILIAIVLSTPIQAGEEIGWRGYALPRLASGLGLARASIVLGAIWACWHLPFFFVPGADKFGQSFPVYLMQVTALSVVAAWLYWRTNQSLLLVMLLHSAVNQTIGLVPSAVPNATNPFAFRASAVAWLTLAVLWSAAAWFLIQMRAARLEDA